MLETPLEKPVNTSRPFREIPGLWLRIFEMNEAFFRNEIPRTSTLNTFYSVLVYTGVVIFSYILQVVFAPNDLFNLDGASQELNFLSIFTGASLVCSLIFIPLLFYISNGIYFGIAKLFGGTGTFRTHAYINSLFFVPMSIASVVLSLVTLIPNIGRILSIVPALFLCCFYILMSVWCYKAVHNLSTGRALGVVFLPVVLILIPLCLLAIFVFMKAGDSNLITQIPFLY